MNLIHVPAVMKLPQNRYKNQSIQGMDSIRDVFLWIFDRLGLTVHHERQVDHLDDFKKFLEEDEERKHVRGSTIYGRKNGKLYPKLFVR